MIKRISESSWQLLEDGRMVADAVLEGLDTGVPDLFIRVNPAYEGQRRAQVLLDAVITAAVEGRYGGVSCAIPRPGPRAVALCERNGFEIVATTPDAFVFLRKIPLAHTPSVEVEMRFGPLTVRGFLPGDQARAAAFFDQMSGTSRSFFNRNGCNRRNMLRQIEEPTPSQLNLVAVDADGTIAGWCFLWNWGSGVPDLGIAIAEAWQGKGLAGMLMAAARNNAERAGCGGIALTTSGANVRAQQLYERRGYERLGDRMNEVMYLCRFPRERGGERA